jgi:endonuclease/exonuclease/phosphatase (EEP) superfamily protein YafD
VAVPAVVVWLLVAPVAVWAAVRTLGLERGSFLIQVTAFTPYVAAVSAMPLVVALLARERWAAVVAGLACLALAFGVLPRAFGNPSAGTSAEARLIVMSVNLRLGQADAASIVDLVRGHDVDVLTLQEFTTAAQEALDAAGLSTVAPFGERRPADGAAGSAVYSREPVTNAGVTQGYWSYQARAVLHPGGSAVTVESVHPPPPVSRAGPGWTQALREQTPAGEPGTRVLAGDFNATLDHAELRRLVYTGYRDAASAVGAGLVPTWPYYGPRTPVTPKVTIDHILVSGAIRVGDFVAVTVPGTDHRAIIAALYIGR